MVDTHADPADIGVDIINPIGDGLAKGLINKVMVFDLIGASLRAPLVYAIPLAPSM